GEAVSKASEGYFRGHDLLAGLMTGCHCGMRSAFDALHLEAAHHRRMALVGDIDGPHEGGDIALVAHDVLIGDDHVAPTIDREGQWQRCMRGAAEGWRPVKPGDELWLCHILNIENDKAGQPIAGVEAVAEPQRVVAAVGILGPGRLFAAGGPLSRRPPAAHFLGSAWIL